MCEINNGKVTPPPSSLSIPKFKSCLDVLSCNFNSRITHLCFLSSLISIVGAPELLSDHNFQRIQIIRITESIILMILLEHIFISVIRDIDNI